MLNRILLIGRLVRDPELRYGCSVFLLPASPDRWGFLCWKAIDRQDQMVLYSD
jgi:hypothetical protein